LSFADTRSDLLRNDFLEGNGFLLPEDSKESADKKVEPAVPDEKEDIVPEDKQGKKNERLPEKLNPGLYRVHAYKY